jgi:hypothetical protein
MITRLKNPVMRRVNIEFSRETEYLGVVLDDKLKEKAIKALMACRGLRWGLTPAMLLWIDIMVVRPMKTYASFLQRLACLMTTRAMKSALAIALCYAGLISSTSFGKEGHSTISIPNAGFINPILGL